MYPEFIVIYIGLIILIVLAVLILIQLKKLSNQSNSSCDNYVTQNPYNGGNPYNTPNQYQANTSDQGQIVFCRNCATQYDASSPYCPTCGTPR